MPGSKPMDFSINLQKSTKELKNDESDSFRMYISWESLPLETLDDEGEEKWVQIILGKGTGKKQSLNTFKILPPVTLLFYFFCRSLYFSVSSKEFYWEDIKGYIMGCQAVAIFKLVFIFYGSKFHIQEFSFISGIFFLEPYLAKEPGTKTRARRASTQRK